MKEFHSRRSRMPRDVTYCPIICMQVISEALRSAGAELQSPVHVSSMPLSAKCSLWIHGPINAPPGWCPFFDFFPSHTDSPTVTTGENSKLRESDFATVKLKEADEKQISSYAAHRRQLKTQHRRPVFAVRTLLLAASHFKLTCFSFMTL